MVPQAGNCCAWRLVEALGEYSTDRRIGPISAGPSLFPSDNVEVRVAYTLVSNMNLLGVL